MSTPTSILFTYQARQFIIESGNLPFEAQREGHDVHVALFWDDPAARAYAQRCRSHGLKVRHYTADLTPVTKEAPLPLAAGAIVDERAPTIQTRSGLRAAFAYLLPPTSPLRRLFSIPGYLAASRYAEKVARSVLDWCRPDVYFSASFGSVIGVENHLTQIARRGGTTLFCYPTYPCYGEDIYIRRRFQNVDMGMWSSALRCDSDYLNRVLARLFPTWTREYQGKRQFAKDPIELVAAWLHGVLDYDPWQKPYDIYDRIYVPYAFSAEALYRNGYRDTQVGMLGKPSIDKVAESCADPAFSGKLLADLGCSPAESFILFNVAPSAEHKNTELDVHLKRFTGICDILKRTGQKVVMSLHPLCDFDRYNRFAQQYGFTISRDYQIYYLQPFCRFVVSHWCTTNYQAALVGKKVIHIDYLDIHSFGDLMLIGPEEIHPNILIIPPDALEETVDQLVAETAQGIAAESGYYHQYVPAGPQIITDALRLTSNRP